MPAQTNPDLDNVKLEEDVRQLIGQEGQEKSVYVVASEGYIHLAGAVKDLADKVKIGSWVEKVPGVRMVTNHLRIRTEGEKTETAHF